MPTDTITLPRAEVEAAAVCWERICVTPGGIFTHWQHPPCGQCKGCRLRHEIERADERNTKED